jgi:hypothetical protein
MERARRITSIALVPLGALLLVLGVLAGYANHVLLDGPTFTRKVDAVRQVEPVSRVVGRTLTDQLLAVRPDLVAARPLIDSVAASVVGSSAFSGPTRAAAANFQHAATVPHASNAVLRVADAGAVLTSALQQFFPQSAQVTPSTVPLNLARVGDQSWAKPSLTVARYLGLAAWLLPATGLALLAGSIVLSRRRRQATLYAGVGVLGWTAVAAVLLLVGGWWARRQDTSTLHGVLVRYGWVEFGLPAWWWLAAVALLTLIVIGSAAAVIPQYDATKIVVRARGVVSHRPRSFALDLLRALIFVVVGAAIVVDPFDALRVAGVIVGALLTLYGVAELGRATNDDTKEQARDRVAKIPDRLRQSRPVAIALVVVLLTTGGYVAWSATSTQAAPANVGVVAGKGLVCDGFAALCGRRYNQVSFAASHNSMAVAGQPGWFLGEQGVSITGQLNNGVRALTIDVWPGQARVSGGVATAPGSHAAAQAVATAEFGPEVVDAGLRVFNAVADPTPSGPPQLYLCHGLCELGATNFADAMAQVRIWLETHPDETVTMIIERHAPADEIGAVLTDNGLAGYAYQPVPGAAWPTLHTMIASGRRLVVMLETKDGGPHYPWLVNAYSSFLQETPFTFRTAADFSCVDHRGSPTAALFLVNHWIFGFRALVTSARAVNSLKVLGGRAERCHAERQLPNFISVNYADIGAIHQVVNELNGVG